MHCFPSQEAEYIVTKIKQQQYQELLSKDQLSMERSDGKVFLHFGKLWMRKLFSILTDTNIQQMYPLCSACTDELSSIRQDINNTSFDSFSFLIHFLLIVDEEEITFAPTYRFERDTREKYAYTKAKATGVSLCLVRCFPCMAPVRPHNAETLQATTEWNKWPRTCFFALRHLCTKLPVRMLWLVENSRYNPFTGTRINLSF